MIGIDSGACEASARNSVITVRANTTLPAHAITQLSPSSTTFWSSPRMDQSDPAGKMLVTAAARGMSRTASDRPGSEISRSPKTTGYVSSPAAAMSVIGIPTSRGWVPQFASIVPKPASTRVLAARCDDWVGACTEPATPLKEKACLNSRLESPGGDEGDRTLDLRIANAAL